ncbi:MAG: hypothetical protein ABW219_12345 [Ilumatobacteraceae bacterium]
MRRKPLAAIAIAALAVTAFAACGDDDDDTPDDTTVVGDVSVPEVSTLVTELESLTTTS